MLHVCTRRSVRRSVSKLLFKSVQVANLKQCAKLLDDSPPDAYPTIAACCTAAYSPKRAWLDTTANMSKGCVYAADNCWLAPPDLRPPNRECVRVSRHPHVQNDRGMQ